MRAGRCIAVTAPGRANLIGNPTDLYGGAVLSCTIARRARVRLEPAASSALVTGDGHWALEPPEGLEARDDGFELARACLRHLGRPEPACRIEFASEIPRESGLGGSSALVVALLYALLAWRGRVFGPYALAEKARVIERVELGIAGGYVDHYMSTFGGLSYLDFRGKQRDRPEAEELYATVEPLAEAAPALPFVLATTGVRHRSGQVHGPIRERWLAGEPGVVAAYERVAEIARLGKRAFLRGAWDELGALMNENHAIQRALGGSGDSNEALIAAALGAGAPGAKLAGAGHGGTIVALWPGEDRAPLRAALRGAGAEEILLPRLEPGVRVEPA